MVAPEAALQPHFAGGCTADTAEPTAGGFRTLLGQFPTGVVAVTAMSDGEPVGLAAGSFFSISLDPLLIGFGIAHTSSTWPRIRDAGAFCINLLAADQHRACQTLAAPGPGKFRTLTWQPSPAGAPVLDGSLAYLDCVLHASHTAGDHDVIIGLVQRFQHLRTAPPLVFYRRNYWSISTAPVAA